jgi:TPR repeat protein
MDSGKTTILNLKSADRVGLPHGDAMLHAVREAAAGVYDLLGELGRNRYGSIVYLGRELATGALTALKLDVSSSNPDELELTVATELDESIPALGYECHFCGEHLDSWGRFCTSCGRDVSGVITDKMSALEREELLVAARSAAAGEYEILGEMHRVRGGGIVYFARELASNQIIALRLQQEPKNERGETEYVLGKTQVLKPLMEGPKEHEPAKPPISPRVDRRDETNASLPNDRNAPKLAEGPVKDRTPTEAPPPPVTPPPVGSRRLIGPIGTRHYVIAGAALALMLAVVVIAVTTGDEPAPKPPPRDTTRQQLPPPPPQPQPQPQPSPPPAADSAELVLLRLPVGAQVTVDGVARRGSVIKLSVGKHLVEATAPGYARSQQQLDLGPGETRRGLRFTRLPDTTKRVTTTPQDTGRQQIAPKATCATVVAASDWQNARQLCATEGRAGNVNAQRQMGLMFMRGLGGTRDEGEAVVWLQRAVDRADRDAQYDLARVFQTSATRRNERRAFDLFTLAANRGHADAQFQLGRIREKGLGVGKNQAEAFHWFQLAADQGHAEAQAGLGVFYMKAQGAPRDDTKALEWLRKGAAGGSSSAMYYLGVFYEEGRAGLPKSRTEARAWYKKSADLGNPEAKKALKG